MYNEENYSNMMQFRNITTFVEIDMLINTRKLIFNKLIINKNFMFNYLFTNINCDNCIDIIRYKRII